MNSEKALREALEPFARALDEWGDDTGQPDRWSAWEHPIATNVTLGDFRRAAEAIAIPSPAPVEREGDDALVEWVARIWAHAEASSSDSGTPPKASDYRDEARTMLAAFGPPPALAPEPVREGQRVGNDELTDAKQLLDMLVAADDEARPNGIMDCIDNDGHPYQSAFMAGLITHARMLVRPYDHAAAIAAFRAGSPLSAREGE